MWLTKCTESEKFVMLSNSRPKFIINSYFEGYQKVGSAILLKADLFPDMKYSYGPIEVELYKDNVNPLIYCQRHINSDGTSDLYFSAHTTRYRKVIVRKKKWWQFWKSSWSWSDPIERVDPAAGTRLKKIMFPEITVEDGIVGLGIKLKK